MSQSSLWQTNQQNNDFAEICNALYERELRVLANSETSSVQNLQGRLKSLTHYINRTANLMTQINVQGLSPLTLDIQNATWSAKQSTKLSLNGQTEEYVFSWYSSGVLPVGLVVPILNKKEGYAFLDCIDRIDRENKRIRANASGWYALNNKNTSTNVEHLTLLKPNKKVMMAACAGHCWQNTSGNKKLRPIIPSLRELLLSCDINWQNFKQPLSFKG